MIGQLGRASSDRGPEVGLERGLKYPRLAGRGNGKVEDTKRAPTDKMATCPLPVGERAAMFML